MVVWYFEEGGVVLWRGWCGTLKRVVWYFEEGCVVLWRGCVVLWRGLCGTLMKVVWYFEEGGVVLWRGWCGTLKRVVCIWYFEECCVVLWRSWCGTLKRLVRYYEEAGVKLWGKISKFWNHFQSQMPWCWSFLITNPLFTLLFFARNCLLLNILHVIRFFQIFIYLSVFYLQGCLPLKMSVWVKPRQNHLLKWQVVWLSVPMEVCPYVRTIFKKRKNLPYTYMRETSFHLKILVLQFHGLKYIPWVKILKFLLDFTNFFLFNFLRFVYFVFLPTAFSEVRQSMLRHSRVDYSQSFFKLGYKELTIAPNAKVK